MDPIIIYIFGISFGISLSIITCCICYLQTYDNQDDNQDDITKEEYQLLKKSVDSGTYETYE